MTLALVILGFSLLVLWRDRSEHAARLNAHQHALDSVLGQLERARRDWQAERKELVKQTDRERQTLLNRIKPETAQYVEPDTIHAPQAVDMFSDEDFWESKEELAERGAREEAAR